MIKVIVSGCYDIIHAGHIEFFKQARSLGDHLTVCFASDETYRNWKHREPALPQDSRAAILRELRCVDEVVMGADCEAGIFDFAAHIEGKDILAVTSDDKYFRIKRDWLIVRYPIQLVVLPKTSRFSRISTTEIRERLIETR